MGFTNFKGIQEMGIICGGGLVICLIPMMTLLPVLLLRGRQNVMDRQRASPAEHRARIEQLWLQRPALTAGVTLALCALAATQLRKVYFDYNLLNMQSKGLPAVEYEKELIRSATKSVLCRGRHRHQPAAGDHVRAAAHQPPGSCQHRFDHRLPQRGPDPQTGRGGRHQAGAWPRCALPNRTSRPVDLQELSGTLYSLRGYLGAALEVVEKDAPELAPQLESLRETIQELRREMLRGDTNRLAANSLKLAAFQRSLFNDVRDTFQALQTQDDRAPLSVADLPRALRDRFVGVTGKYLLMVYPKDDVWKRDVQKEFIEQVGRVDPNVTGTPVQLYHYTALLKESYEQAAWYSLARDCAAGPVPLSQSRLRGAGARAGGHRLGCGWGV